MAAGKNRINNIINSNQLNFFIPISFQKEFLGFINCYCVKKILGCTGHHKSRLKPFQCSQYWCYLSVKTSLLSKVVENMVCALPQPYRIRVLNQLLQQRRYSSSTHYD